MYANRSEVDPKVQAWVDEQLTHFGPGDMDPAVALMRQFDRQRREQPARTRKRSA